MTGISLGGHATLMTMCLDQRILVGAPLIGSGHYRRLMELRARDNGTPVEQFGDYYPAALDDAVRRYDPINHPHRFADRPLLMLNGKADTLVQPECNQEFEQALRPHYTDQERLRLSIHAGVAHEVPPTMWREAADWLTGWLATPGTGHRR